MGCDIHLYLESKHQRGWSDLCTPPGVRDYEMFELMAGVRGDETLFPPRGLPKDIGLSTRHESQLFITEDGNGDHQASRENAAKWVSAGSSSYTDKDKKFITHPDWHSHSWLTADEFGKVIDEYRKRYGKSPDLDYVALHHMMVFYGFNGVETRLVFWFDN